MRFPSRETVERIRKEYPVGTKLRLLEMSDPQSPPVGTIGEVQGVDDCGNVLMRWQNGSGLSFLPDCDRAEIITDESEGMYEDSHLS